jgi:hypothetical protein
MIEKARVDLGRCEIVPGFYQHSQMSISESHTYSRPHWYTFGEDPQQQGEAKAFVEWSFHDRFAVFFDGKEIGKPAAKAYMPRRSRGVSGIRRLD